MFGTSIYQLKLDKSEELVKELGKGGNVEGVFQNKGQAIRFTSRKNLVPTTFQR